jgi:hypothetical protein
MHSVCISLEIQHIFESTEGGRASARGNPLVAIRAARRANLDRASRQWRNRMGSTQSL